MREDSMSINIGHWMKDTMGCSLQAQGLYLRLRFLMHTSFKYGHVDIVQDEAVASLCGCPISEFRRTVQELIDLKIVRVGDAGLLFCRRMVTKGKTRDHFKKVYAKPKFDPVTEQRFNEIWHKYPVQIGRDKALKSFAESVRSDKDWVDIKLALENYKKQIRDPQYTVHGGNWFGRWGEYLQTYSPPSQLEEETRKKAAWQSKGLSKCHGAQLFSDDGIQRCSTCRMSQ